MNLRRLPPLFGQAVEDSPHDQRLRLVVESGRIRLSGRPAFFSAAASKSAQQAVLLVLVAQAINIRDMSQTLFFILPANRPLGEVHSF